jgi:hypothetical protein
VLEGEGEVLVLVAARDGQLHHQHGRQQQQHRQVRDGQRRQVAVGGSVEKSEESASSGNA